jgi:CubicO group peptidase (beta-lactamase class C family)
MNVTGDYLTERKRQDIDSFVDEQLVEWNVPGGGVVVFDADGVVYGNAYGARSLDPVESATTDSLFHVASVTKSFTAIALMQFVEQGAIALEDSVGEYVDFLGDAPGEPIILGELLTHSSGIPSDTGQMGGRIADMVDFVRRFDRWAEQRLTDRDRVMYLNRGYVVLGALVSALADRPYPEHVTEAVLEPMGMDQSTFDQGAIEDNPDAMAGYVVDDGDVEPTPMDTSEFPAVREELYGVGGLISTLTDLAAVGPLLLDGGTVGGEQVLESSTIEEMQRPQSPPVPTVDGYDFHLGYGWLVEDCLDDTLVYSGGGVPGYGTFVGILQDRELGVALGVNNSTLPKIDVGQGILALACGEDPYESVRFLQATRAVESVSGTYEAARTGTTATVEPAGSEDAGVLNTKISVSIDDEFVFRAAFDGDGPEGPTFASVMGNGFRWTVEFLEQEEGTVMLWSRGHRGIRFDKA